MERMLPLDPLLLLVKQGKGFASRKQESSKILREGGGAPLSDDLVPFLPPQCYHELTITTLAPVLFSLMII